MKKNAILISVVFLIFLFASCGEKKDKETTDENVEQTEVTPEVDVDKTPETEGDKTAEVEEDDDMAEYISKILIGGTWEKSTSDNSSESLIFGEDGKVFWWTNTTEEGETKWEVKGASILHFYDSDYIIENITGNKLVVTLEGVETTYTRVLESNVADCTPKFKLEGINDAKGFYENTGLNASWTIHFGDNDFVIFYTKNGVQGEVMIVDKIERISDCEYKMIIEGQTGEKAPQWKFRYNNKGYYDLVYLTYSEEHGTWFDVEFDGSDDNG